MAEDTTTYTGDSKKGEGNVETYKRGQQAKERGAASDAAAVQKGMQNDLGAIARAAAAKRKMKATPTPTPSPSASPAAPRKASR